MRTKPNPKQIWSGGGGGDRCGFSSNIDFSHDAIPCPFLVPSLLPTPLSLGARKSRTQRTTPLFAHDEKRREGSPASDGKGHTVCTLAFFCVFLLFRLCLLRLFLGSVAPTIMPAGHDETVHPMGKKDEIKSPQFLSKNKRKRTSKALRASSSYGSKPLVDGPHQRRKKRKPIPRNTCTAVTMKGRHRSNAEVT